MFSRQVGFSVTEDLSKKTREARLELRKFMREVKRKNPEKNCFMEQDKLFVDGKIYVFSETENRVVEQRIAEKILNKNEKNRYNRKFFIFIFLKLNKGGQQSLLLYVNLSIPQLPVDGLNSSFACRA